MKQKGEFYKVKKSGFSMLLLLICVSMLSVMPVSAATDRGQAGYQPCVGEFPPGQCRSG